MPSQLVSGWISVNHYGINNSSAFVHQFTTSFEDINIILNYLSPLVISFAILLVILLLFKLVYLCFYSHLRSTKVNLTFSCFLAHSTSLNIASLSGYSWIIDSGATYHMTSHSNSYTSYNPCSGRQKVKVADGTLFSVAGKGCIPISKDLSLDYDLHVPKLSCNLLSISKITKDLNYVVKFFLPIVNFRTYAWERWLALVRRLMDSTTLKVNLQVQVICLIHTWALLIWVPTKKLNSGIKG